MLGRWGVSVGRGWDVECRFGPSGGACGFLWVGLGVGFGSGLIWSFVSGVLGVGVRLGGFVGAFHLSGFDPRGWWADP
jgi:hypothetical protein